MEIMFSSIICVSDGNKIKEIVNKEILDFMVGCVFCKKMIFFFLGKCILVDDVRKFNVDDC